jgi:hypothetical protein
MLVFSGIPPFFIPILRKKIILFKTRMRTLFHSQRKKFSLIFLCYLIYYDYRAFMNPD